MDVGTLRVRCDHVRRLVPQAEQSVRVEQTSPAGHGNAAPPTWRTGTEHRGRFTREGSVSLKGIMHKKKRIRKEAAQEARPEGHGVPADQRKRGFASAPKRLRAVGTCSRGLTNTLGGRRPRRVVTPTLVSPPTQATETSSAPHDLLRRYVCSTNQEHVTRPLGEQTQIMPQIHQDSPTDTPCQIFPRPFLCLNAQNLDGNLPQSRQKCERLSLILVPSLNPVTLTLT